MDLKSRIEKYRRIEEYRKRPLIAYVTSTRANVNSRIAGDQVREFIDQLDAIPSGNSIDILLHSAGGDALAAWKLMSILRERFDHVEVLVPFAAFSAATVFALGADLIVMHPHASLGPIDPQITGRAPDGSGRQFSFEDLGGFLRFLNSDADLKTEEQKARIVDRLFATVDPLVVGGAKRASELAAEVGERLLSMHMKNDPKAKQIAVNLNKSFFAHSDAVSRSRAKSLELKVADPDKSLEQLIWDAYLGWEGYLELRQPFNPLEVFMNAPGSQAQPPTPPTIAAGVPQAVAAQIMAQWQAQVMAGGAPEQVVADYTVVHALIESPRFASEYRTTGAVIGQRFPNKMPLLGPNGIPQIAGVDKTGAWTRVL